MSSKILYCAEKKISQTKVLFTAIGLIVPFGVTSLIRTLQVTFDDAITLLLGILMVIILLITYYEAKTTVKSMRNNRLELTRGHLVQIKESKKELIFYREIESIEVIQRPSGKVKRVKIRTPYRMTTIEGYDSLEKLVDFFEAKGYSLDRYTVFSIV
jgi:hypothetical protein